MEVFKKETKKWYKRTLFGLLSFMSSGTATQMYLKHVNTTFRNENPFGVGRGVAPRQADRDETNRRFLQICDIDTSVCS